MFPTFKTKVKDAQVMSVHNSSAEETRTCDWLCEFQNVNPAHGCFVAIGFLSSSGPRCHFRLHDDDATASIQKERRKTGKYLSWREQWKLNINSGSIRKERLCDEH